ncbi:hypothetical protein OAU99_01585 [Candidatus Poseidoniaceae archaeon]|nr:hypothetical protein [Candidatus Poseidoniaceae archaeon]
MLEESQICNLHVALKNQFPLPEQTLIDTVRKCFNNDEWLPNDEDGFTLIEEKSESFCSNQILHYYIDQTQDYFLLSRNEFGDKESQSQKGVVQSNFDSFIDNDVILNISQSITLARLEYLTNPEGKIDTSCYIDAWINVPNGEIMISLDLDFENIEPIMDESIKRILSHEEISTFDEEKRYEMLFSLFTQIELSPRGPLAQIRSTNLGLKDSIRTTVGVNDSGKPHGHGYSVDELKMRITILDSISKQCITEDMQEDLELGPSRVLQMMEHYKIRVSFVAEMIDFSDTEHSSFIILENRIKAFISNADGVYEDNLFTPYHIKDALILLIIKGNAASMIGIERIKQYFDKLLELSGKDQKFIQSVEFNRDHFCLDGDIRLDSLMKHRDNAHSKFLQGLIDYFIGTSLELDNPDRVKRLLSSLEVLHGSDNIRFSLCLQNLVAGFYDIREDGNPIRRSPSLEQDDLTIRRLSSIVNELQHYSNELCSTVLWDIEDYLIFRITKHRQRCNSCDFPHIYLQRINMNINEKDIIEFSKSLDQISEMKQDESVLRYVQSLKECLFVLSETNLGKSLFEQPKNPIHDPTKYLIKLLEDPVGDTVARYDFTKIKTEDLFEVTGSLVLHLLEPMFNEVDRHESMRMIGLQVKDELTNCSDIKRELILSFISDLLKDIQDIESSSKWIDLLSIHSLIMLDGLLLSNENLSNSELGFVLIIAKHVEHVDLYSFARNANAREEHGEVIQNILLDGLKLSDIGELIETPEVAKENTDEISKILFSVLNNSNLKLIGEVSSNWRVEEGDGFDKIFHILQVIQGMSANLENLPGSSQNLQSLFSNYLLHRLNQNEGAESWQEILDD